MKAYLGSLWLDSTLPDWHNRIDLPRLNSSSERYCVAGQLFTYKDFLKFKTPKWVERHGFSLTEEFQRGWLDMTVCRRLYEYHVYPRDWRWKNQGRMSFRNRGGMWFDLGVIYDDADVAMLMARTNEFTSLEVLKRIWKG